MVGRLVCPFRNLCFIRQSVARFLLQGTGVTLPFVDA
jgi:hypothetical protein